MLENKVLGSFGGATNFEKVNSCSHWLSTTEEDLTYCQSWNSIQLGLGPCIEDHGM